MAYRQWPLLMVCHWAAVNFILQKTLLKVSFFSVPFSFNLILLIFYCNHSNFTLVFDKTNIWPVLGLLPIEY